jgi:hypothetical protein
MLVVQGSVVVEDGGGVVAGGLLDPPHADASSPRTRAVESAFTPVYFAVLI